MAAEFCTPLLDAGAAGEDPGASGSRRAQQGAQPLEQLLPGCTARPIPSSPGSGAGGLQSSLGLPGRICLNGRLCNSASSEPGDTELL